MLALGIVLRMLACLILGAITSACDQSAGSAGANPQQSIAPLTSCEAVLQPRSASIAGDSVELVVVPDMEPVCDAELVSVLRLMPSDAEDGLLAAPSIAKRSDGVYVSAVFGENALVVWDSSGMFVRRIGRSGAGPGEFSSGIQPIFGPGDTLYAIDNSRHLSVFDNDFRYMTRSIQPAANAPSGSWFLTADGRRFVSPPPSTARSSHHVAELDAKGNVRQLLVPADPERTGSRFEEAERTIACDGDNSFWVGPDQVPTQAYEMEQWSLDGRLLRCVRREAEWYVPHTSGPNADTSASPSTYFAMLQVDSSGFIHTALSRTEAKPLPPEFRTNRESRKQGISVRWKVLDPHSGTLVASTLMTNADSVPMPFIPRTNTARILVTDDLNGYVDIVRWRFVPRVQSQK